MVSIEVDALEVIDDLTPQEKQTLVSDLVESGYGPDGYGHMTAMWFLSDPTNRLEVIVALRQLGYSVELVP
jgi:hypothetical protein